MDELSLITSFYERDASLAFFLYTANVVDTPELDARLSESLGFLELFVTKCPSSVIIRSPRVIDFLFLPSLVPKGFASPQMMLF